MCTEVFQHSWGAWGKGKGCNDSSGVVPFSQLCNHWHKAALPNLLQQDLQTARGQGTLERQLGVRKTAGGGEKPGREITEWFGLDWKGP